MAITVEAQGREFTFPDGTTNEQIGFAVDEFFTEQQPSQQVAAQPAAQQVPPQQQATDLTALARFNPALAQSLAAQQQQFERGEGPVQAITGQARETEVTRRLPELGFGEGQGFFAGQDLSKVAGVVPALQTTTNPSEIADIVTSNFPNISATFNKDAKGNVFPVLTNTETGQSVLVNKPGISGMDVLQGLSLGAAFTPAGRATTILGAAGKSAATEAGLQGVQELSGGEFNEADVALAAGFGAGFKGVEGAIKGAGRLAQAAPENQLVRASEDAGIPLFTSDVLQPKTFAAKTLQQTGEKIPVAGTGQLRVAQQEFREKAVDEVADKYGEFSWDAIINSLRGKKDRVKQAAGNVMNSAETKLDDIGEVPLSSTLQAIDDLKANLSKPGVIRSQADDVALAEVDNLLTTMTETGQIFSSLKQNRTAFREIVESVDKAERTQLTSRAKAQMQKVLSGMKSDMDSFSKANLPAKEFAKLQKANSVYAGEAQKLKKTKLKNVLDKGDITPESVKPMLFSQNASELRTLNNSLGPSGRANARSAIISRIFTDLSKRQAGITPNSFATELKKFKPQVDTFFKGEEKRQLLGLQKALEATRRAQDAGITTPTGQQLLGGLTAASLYTNPLATLGTTGTVGGLARLYESAPVRNALLRLSAAPKGEAFEQALSEFQSVLLTASQVVRSEQSGIESPQQ